MIIHIDLDCFFVSAERTLDPSLEHRPVGIGGRGDQRIFASQSGHQSLNLDTGGSFVGAFFQTYEHSLDDRAKFIDPDGRVRGILTTASYEARRFGIRTGTPIGEALRRCPELIVKAPNMQLYQRLSHALHDFLQHRIPLVEQASIDEFYGDLEGWVEPREVPWFIDMLRHEIRRQLNLPVSIGAARTKSIAKLATESAKPFGCRTVFEHERAAFLDPIPVAEFPGIGRAMRRRLERYRIETLGELLRAPTLVQSWGPYAQALYRRVDGTDRDRVLSGRVRKSIGISRTFDPVADRTELHRRVLILSRHLAYAVGRLDVIPTTFQVSVKYANGQRSNAALTEARLFGESRFKTLCLSLFHRADRHRELPAVRLGIHCSHFTKNSRRELSLLEFDADRRDHALGRSLNEVRKRYGPDMLRWGGEFNSS